MKAVLLDSSFIIAATKKKIDFFDELQEYQEILVPEQVIEEIFKVSQSKQSLKTKQSAELALKILEVESAKFKKIDVGKGHTDNQIVKYAKENPGVLVATIDKDLKSKISGEVIVLRGKKARLV